MTYFQLYKFLKHKACVYNPYLNALEDFSSLIRYEPFSNPIFIDFIGRDGYTIYYGTRDLQSFYQDRRNLRKHLSLTEAKLKHPEFFI